MMKSKVRSGLSRSRVPANSKLPSGQGLGEVLAAPGAADLHPVKWEPHLYNCTIEASSVKWEWQKFLPFEAMRVEYAVKVKPFAPYLSPSSREQKLVLIFRFFSALWVVCGFCLCGKGEGEKSQNVQMELLFHGLETKKKGDCKCLWVCGVFLKILRQLQQEGGAGSTSEYSDKNVTLLMNLGTVSLCWFKANFDSIPWAYVCLYYFLGTGGLRLLPASLFVLVGKSSFLFCSGVLRWGKGRVPP